VRRDILLRSLTRDVQIADLSNVVGSPTMAERRQEVLEMAASIRTALNSESGLVEMRLGLSGPTLMGLLVGYPFLYWLHPDATENCLGGVAVTIFKVEGQHSALARDHLISSFSVPNALLTAHIRVSHRKLAKITIK